MESYQSTSSRKHNSRTIRFLFLVALTVTLHSTAAWAQMGFFSGDAKRRITLQVWEECASRAYAVRDRTRSVGDYGETFAKCIDRSLNGLTGLYFAVLARDSNTNVKLGYSWNYESLTAGFDRARRERGSTRNCSLKAFAINGCIAYGKDLEAGHHGYGVGATKEEALHRFRHGPDARFCGPDCKLWKVYCTG